VMKFAGSALRHAADLERVADIVARRRDERPLVVVSALAGVTDEVSKDGERLWPERDRLRTPPELFVRRVETKPAECNRLPLQHYRNTTAT